MNEYECKQGVLQALLSQGKIDCLALTRVSSFARATCGGASYVNTAASDGVATLLVTRHQNYLITNNIESARLEREEVLGCQGWEFIVEPWYEPGQAFSKLTMGLKVGADAPIPGLVDFSAEIARLLASGPRGTSPFPHARASVR